MSCSMCSSFSVSPCSSRPAGMPVHAEITSAMSSAPTRSLTMTSLYAVPPAPAPDPPPAAPPPGVAEPARAVTSDSWALANSFSSVGISP